MRGPGGLSVIHVPDTGHTPTLGDGLLIGEVARWVHDDRLFGEGRVRPAAAWPKRMLYPDDRQSL